MHVFIIPFSNFVYRSISVYDTLTGKIVRNLEGHRSCVRDVSWHPYDNTIISTSVRRSVICLHHIDFYIAML